MCGIVGAIGVEDIVGKIADGLKKLEYRGYDSAGVSVLDGGVFKTVKEEGKIVNLVAALRDSELVDYFGEKESVDSSNLMAIGHTRWATHGRVSQENSHPHASSRVCVVHNGIIENYQEIREKLAQNGANFLSETDSEVVPHLLEVNLAHFGEVKAALMATLGQIKGSYALAMMVRGNEDFMVVAKKGSPLLVGLGGDGNYIASDYYALANYTNEVVYLRDGEFAFVYKDRVEFFDESGANVKREVKLMENLENEADKGDFDHFMLKEIYEQPEVIAKTVQNYANLGDLAAGFDFSGVNKLTIVACGTSYYAGMVAKYWIEEIAKIEVEVDIASEFRYRKNVFRDDNLMLFISQSGETADTIAALKHAKEAGQRILSIVNVQNSSMAELSDAVIRTLAGVEIGVASTKAYVAQLSVLALLAARIAVAKGLDVDEEGFLRQISASAVKISEILRPENVVKIQEVARHLTDFRHILFVGRGVSYVSALEGALKLREISYIDAQAIAAGELKHGTIALIDENMPVVAVVPENELFDKVASNIEEIKARDGRVVALSSVSGLKELSGLVDFGLVAPEISGVIEEGLVLMPALQLLAYYVALFKGNDVDQPRNLAKSVTVE